MKPRLRTVEEMDALVASANVPESDEAEFRAANRYTAEEVGRLRGLYVFQQEIRDVLVAGILEPLQQLCDLDEIDDLKTPRLKVHSDWCDSIDDHLAEAQMLIDEGREFFTAENIRLLDYLPLTEASQRNLAQLTWDAQRSKVRDLDTPRRMA